MQSCFLVVWRGAGLVTVGQTFVLFGQLPRESSEMARLSAEARERLEVRYEGGMWCCSAARRKFSHSEKTICCSARAAR